MCCVQLLSCIRLFADPRTVRSLPSFSAHGIFQARILEWGDISYPNMLLTPYISYFRYFFFLEILFVYLQFFSFLYYAHNSFVFLNIRSIFFKGYFNVLLILFSLYLFIEDKYQFKDQDRDLKVKVSSYPSILSLFLFSYNKCLLLVANSAFNSHLLTCFIFNLFTHLGIYIFQPPHHAHMSYIDKTISSIQNGKLPFLHS